MGSISTLFSVVLYPIFEAAAPGTNVELELGIAWENGKRTGLSHRFSIMIRCFVYALRLWPFARAVPDE